VLIFRAFVQFHDMVFCLGQAKVVSRDDALPSRKLGQVISSLCFVL